MASRSTEAMVDEPKLKLPRFRGHPTVWVFGVHNGKEAPTLRAGIPPADD
jgi:hypothetical protein